MGLGHGSFGQELWSGFFSVVGSFELRQGSVRSLTLCHSTPAPSLTWSLCQREFDYSEISGEERRWEDFLVEIPVRPCLSHFLTLAHVQKLTKSVMYHCLGATT